MNIEVIELHNKNTGVLKVQGLIDIDNEDDLAKAYTPGVAELSLMINKNNDLARELTVSGKLICVITDGTAVLGLGNVGSQAGLPIVEGKSLLYKSLADVNAIPMAINQISVNQIVETIKNIENSFAGIHLEDIAAPQCFEILEKLENELSIPVYHDDQTGTAIVVLAALMNASKLANKNINDLNIIITGAGASGLATAELLFESGIKNITLVDIEGTLIRDDAKNNYYQNKILNKIGIETTKRELKDEIIGKDVFIGLSTGNIVTKEMIESMNKQPIIFALANPIPEILPEEAKKGNAKIVATGSSNYPNQVNNILVFPGLFKGLLLTKGKDIGFSLQKKVAESLAELVGKPSYKKFIPNVFDEGVSEVVSKTVVRHFRKSKLNE